MNFLSSDREEYLPLLYGRCQGSLAPRDLKGSDLLDRPPLQNPGYAHALFVP